MLSGVLRKTREVGLRKSAYHYAKHVGLRMSPNYRQDTARFKRMSWPAFLGFLLFDCVRKTLDDIVCFIDNAFVGRKEIARQDLDEYVIRLLRSDLMNENSVVYAFGISRHIETEEEMAKRIGCTLHLFDPTPPAIEFMQKHTPNPKLVFEPIGVWTKTEILKFHWDRHRLRRNLSVINYYNVSEFIEAPCYTLTDIMKRKGHTHIDVLKMDIEGAALPVLLDMLKNTSIRPRQIVGALERPQFAYGASLMEVVRVLVAKAKLFSALEKAEYRTVTHDVAEFTAIRSMP